MESIIHPKTTDQIERLAAAPPHALLITGPVGSGKQTVARLLAGEMLNLAADRLESSPSWQENARDPNEPYGVETVKSVRHFLTLRSSAKTKAGVNKIVLINQADKLSQDGQNSLLKILEEPPAGCLLILTATSSQSLLPTVASRCQTLTILKPERKDAVEILRKQFSEEQVTQALDLVDGWPEAAAAILNDTSDHPLPRAATQARALLTKTTFERLAMVDKLSKQREEAINICQVLQRMARVAAARQNINLTGAARWAKIQLAAYDCENSLSQSANTKLSLTELMLNL